MPLVKNDQRELSGQRWREIQELQERMRTGSREIMKSPEIADAVEALMRECRRLRTAAEFELIRGYNEGYDNGYAEGRADAEIISSGPPF